MKMLGHGLKAMETPVFGDSCFRDLFDSHDIFRQANRIVLSRGGMGVYAWRVVGPDPLIAHGDHFYLRIDPLGDPQTAVHTLFLCDPGSGVTDTAGMLAWIDQRIATAQRVVMTQAVGAMLEKAGRSLGTAACLPSARECALAILGQDLGAEVQDSVRRRLAAACTHDAQVSEPDMLEPPVAHRFDDLHAWMKTALHHDLKVQDMADFCGTSLRTFLRHYPTATGMTPTQALAKLRVDAAIRLANDGMILKRIPMRCGFGTMENMRRAFQRIHGQTPKEFFATARMCTPCK